MRLLIQALGVALLVTLAGCGSSSKPARSVSTGAASATTVKPPTSPEGPGYEGARQQWIGAGLVISSASQNTAFSLAVDDLESGRSTDTGNRSAYPSIISSIEDIERLPITSVTPAQDAEFDSDAKVVNAFFDLTPKAVVASCGPDNAPATAEAAAAWFSEPGTTSSGVVVQPLETAVRDLETQEAEDSTGTSCYPAAIDDLENLESASSAEIAASAGEGTGNDAASSPIGAEIDYLNEFFGRTGAAGSSVLTN